MQAELTRPCLKLENTGEGVHDMAPVQRHNFGRLFMCGWVNHEAIGVRA